jgi:RNA polymerase sigma factor (sigma-70 family)
MLSEKRQSFEATTGDLCLRHQAGDKKASNELVKMHDGLARSFVLHYVRRRRNFREQFKEDLEQQARIGLMRAFDLFDPSRGFTFATYAMHWIRHHVLRWMDDNRDIVRTPVYVLVRHRKQAKEDTPEEARLGPKTLVRTRSYDDPNVMQRFSGDAHDDRLFDEIFKRDDETLTIEEELDERFVALLCRRIVAKFPWRNEQERYVMLRRYSGNGEDLTEQTVIASELGLTRQRIQQIEVAACNRLRAWACRHGAKYGLAFTQIVEIMAKNLGVKA